MQGTKNINLLKAMKRVKAVENLNKTEHVTDEKKLYRVVVRKPSKVAINFLGLKLIKKGEIITSFTVTEDNLIDAVYAGREFLIDAGFTAPTSAVRFEVCSNHGEWHTTLLSAEELEQV
jgi:hypothetical protein